MGFALWLLTTALGMITAYAVILGLIVVVMGLASLFFPKE